MLNGYHLDILFMDKTLNNDLGKREYRDQLFEVYATIPVNKYSNWYRVDLPVNVNRFKTIYPQSVGYIKNDGTYQGLDQTVWTCVYTNDNETLRVNLRYDIGSEAAGSTCVVKFYAY